MAVIEGFLKWWNRLAATNGKSKFKTQEEALEFVRRVHEKNGGPNEKVKAMRDEYERINRAKLEKTGSH